LIILGKEIDFDQLIGLNPTLLTMTNTDETPSPQPQLDMTAIKSKVVTNGKSHAPAETEQRLKRRQTTNIPALPALAMPANKSTAVKATNGRVVADRDRRMKPVKSVSCPDKKMTGI